MGNNTNSPLWRHCMEIHDNEIQSFVMNVTGTYKDDAMLRQISEAVQINNTDICQLMNTKGEWNITRIPRANITEN